MAAMASSTATEGIDIQAFVAKQKELLLAELRSEQGEESEVAGTGHQRQKDSSSSEERPQNVLRGLRVESVTVGLYGRTVVHLESGSLVSATSSSASSADVSDVLDGSKEASASVPTARSSTGTGGCLLPSHRLTVGDEVEILGRNGSSSSGRKRNGGGVICALDDATISIALFGQKRASTTTNGADASDDSGDDFGLGIGSPPFTVVPKSSAAVHRKMIDALDELSKAGAGHDQAGAIIGAVFGAVDGDTRTTSTGQANQGSSISAKRRYNGDLDVSQEEAIDFTLGGGSVGLIHGPPGTGKTTTVVELIRRAVYDKGWKVLVTAPSNVAVDNVLEKLVANNSDVKISRRSRKVKSDSSSGDSIAVNAPTPPPRRLRAVRLGHPARIKASIQPYSLESLVHRADGTEVVNDVRKELESFVKVLSDEKSRYADRRVARREVKVLRSELRQREEAVVDDLISNADVVLATNVGASSSALNKYINKRGGGFDLVVIDEAAQALEASCWIPILRGERLILAGDHKQLPPTIKCNEARVQRELGLTMFERVMRLYGDDQLSAKNHQQGSKGRISRMLQTQYRMNAAIADWASTASYGNNLLSHESCKDHKLSDLHHISVPPDDAMDFAPLLFIDTAGCDMFESVNAAGSRYNEEEARIVAHHVQKLLMVGVDPREIAVISPYNGQVEILRLMLLPAVPSLEIRSVDGFQGGEREAVILSLVRSSERGGAVGGGIGFLRDERRLNVAITRARRHCCVIADSETVSRSPFIKSLLTWVEKRGEHRSAAEFAPEEVIVASSGEVSGPAVPAEAASKQKSSEPRDQASSTGKKVHAGTNKSSVRSSTEEQRRKKLMNKISSFSETAGSGEKMVVGTNMSKFDELVACELAQQLGLEHSYEGSEGINRKLILQKRDNAKDRNRDVEKDGSDDSDDVVAAKQTSAFAALNMDDDDSDSEKSHDGLEKKKNPGPSSKNSLLADLARERMEREKQKQVDQQSPAVISAPKAPASKSSKAKKKKKKKKGGGKGGGGGASAAAGESEKTEDEDIDDDLAFLDAQIEQVQTSHGRKVEGSGKAYKSIINGVLLAKPEPRAPKKDIRAQNALKEKLKKAGDDRKAKGKDKKKK